ncbi:MAG: 50S ribosomal protein L9 [Candidatus Spechtbacterales bacterium]
MKVILLQDIKNIGKKWEVKKVSDGYARNFLLPKKLVRAATPEALQELKADMEKQEVVATEDLEQVEELVASLDGYELVLQEKAGNTGKLYAGLTEDKILKELKKKGFKIKKASIRMDNPIKEVGEYEVVLEFDHGLEAEIKIIVESLE